MAGPDGFTGLGFDAPAGSHSMSGWPCRHSCPRWVSNERFSCMSTTMWPTGLELAARARVDRAGHVHARRAAAHARTVACAADDLAVHGSPADAHTDLVACADVGAPTSTCSRTCAGTGSLARALAGALAGARVGARVGRRRDA